MRWCLLPRCWVEFSWKVSDEAVFAAALCSSCGKGQGLTSGHLTVKTIRPQEKEVTITFGERWQLTDSLISRSVNQRWVKASLSRCESKFAGHSVARELVWLCVWPKQGRSEVELCRLFSVWLERVADWPVALSLCGFCAVALSLPRGWKCHRETVT